MQSNFETVNSTNLSWFNRQRQKLELKQSPLIVKISTHELDLELDFYPYATNCIQINNGGLFKQTIALPSSDVVGLCDIDQHNSGNYTMLENIPFILPLSYFFDGTQKTVNEITLTKLPQTDFFITGYK